MGWGIYAKAKMLGEKRFLLCITDTKRSSKPCKGELGGAKCLFSHLQGTLEKGNQDGSSAQKLIDFLRKNVRKPLQKNQVFINEFI